MQVCREEQRIRNEIAAHTRSNGTRATTQIASLWLQLAELRVSVYDVEGAVRLLQEAQAMYPEHRPLGQRLEYYLTRLGEPYAAKKEP